MFLHPGVVQAEVLTTRAFNIQASFNQGLLQLKVLKPEVLIPRGSYSHWGLRTRAPSSGGSYNEGSHNQGFLCVHKDIEWNLDEIINIYAREYLRRMKLLNLLGGDGDSKILLMLSAK